MANSQVPIIGQPRNNVSYSIIWKYLGHVLQAFCLFSISSCSLFEQNDNFAEHPLAKDQSYHDHYSEGVEFALASQGKASSLIGQEILKIGNLVDAAVAMSFALAVERPQSTGIGGGGFLLLYLEGKTSLPQAWDFRERAPLAANAKTFEGKDPKSSRQGVLSSGVPGLVAGLYDIHKLYGTLGWSQVVNPAVKLAKDGFPIYYELAEAISKSKKLLLEDSAMAKVFAPQGKLLEKKDLLVQTDLAKTLSLISRLGKDAFYQGELAEKIVAFSQAKKGLFEKRDFQSYEVKRRAPVRGEVGKYQFYSMPAPSSAGLLLKHIFATMKLSDLDLMTGQDLRTLYFLQASFLEAFKVRAQYLGDSDFVDIPHAKIFNSQGLKKKMLPYKDYWKRKAFREDEVSLDTAPIQEESVETTHFSLISSKGAISSTQTINGRFGAHVMVPGTGIILNNEMDDFSVQSGRPNQFGALGSKANEVASGKRPLSSMGPTLVFKNNLPVMSVGAPGGTQNHYLHCSDNAELFEFQLHAL